MVVEVNGRSVTLETLEKSACGGCKAKNVCGHGVLARQSAKRCLLEAVLDPSLRRVPRPGDWVKLSYPDKDLLQLTGLIYILPISLLVIAITLGDYFGLSTYSLLAVVIATMIIAGYAVRAIQQKVSFSTQPVVDAIIDIQLVGK